MALATHATLATVAVDRAVGFPFGSLVACAADDAGRTVLCLSDLAVHAVNLAADPRASVLVAAQAVGDPLAAARVTVVGDLREVPADERAAVRDGIPAGAQRRLLRGLRRLPRLPARADGRPLRRRVRPHELGVDRRLPRSRAGPAPIAVRSDPATTCNDDHADALVAFCRCSAGRAEVTAARMVGVDRYGFDVLATSSPHRRARCGSASTPRPTLRTPCARR